MASRLSVTLWLLCLSVGWIKPVCADEAAKAQAPTPWVRLEVFPPKVVIHDARESVQLVVTAYDAQNQVTDVTADCSWQVSDANLAKVEGARIRASQDAPEARQLELEVKLGELSVKTPVEIQAVAAPKPIALKTKFWSLCRNKTAIQARAMGRPAAKVAFDYRSVPSMRNWMHSPSRRKSSVDEST